MPLLFRSFPLSFHTLWRYLLILPLLAPVAILFAIVAGFIPVVNLLVPGTITAFFAIMGIRCALAARGHSQPPDYGQLLRVSFVFGFINVVAQYGIKLIGAALGWALSLIGVEVTTIGLMTGLASWSPYWNVILLIGLAPYALYASAIAVPMTAATVSGSGRSPDASIFFGLGAGMFSLSLILLVWLVAGSFFSIVGEVWTMFAMLLSTLTTLARGDEITWGTGLHSVELIACSILMTWASSWFYATAVLAWEDASQRKAASRATSVNVNRPTADTLRALREARAQR
ncbi:MAG: hypothetical protein ACRC6I_05890 [Paracoccaceae bacterium]